MGSFFVSFRSIYGELSAQGAEHPLGSIPFFLLFSSGSAPYPAYFLSNHSPNSLSSAIEHSDGDLENIALSFLTK